MLGLSDGGGYSDRQLSNTLLLKVEPIALEVVARMTLSIRAKHPGK